MQKPDHPALTRTSIRPLHWLVWLLLASPPALLAADAREIARTVCAACHGVDGNSADPAHPKLAGMDQEYLVRQLRAFADGKRRDETMAGIVAALDPAQFAGLAA